MIRNSCFMFYRGFQTLENKKSPRPNGLGLSSVILCSETSVRHSHSFLKYYFTKSQSPLNTNILYTLIKMHKPKPVGRPFISGSEGPYWTNLLICGYIPPAYGTDLARDLFSSRTILDYCLPLLRDKGLILLQNSPWCYEFMEASMQKIFIPLLLSDVALFLWFLYSFHAASLGFRAWSLDNRLRREIWLCISGEIHGNWSPYIHFFLNWRMIIKNLVEKFRPVIPHVIHIGGEHSGVQRRKIKKWIYFGRKNELSI